MPFEALAHALTTMPLGGFSTEARSLEPFAPGDAVGASRSSWRSRALNFALLYLALVRAPSTRRSLRDEEVRLYVVLLLARRPPSSSSSFCTQGLFDGEEAIRTGRVPDDLAR